MANEANSMAAKGIVPKQYVTAVLLRGSTAWLEIIPTTFDLCEINIVDEVTGTSTGGIVGFKFACKGLKGRNSWVFTQMDSIAAIQLEEPPAPGGGVT